MYTINEVATMCDITAHTLRFYDKEGLLPFIGRSETGNRVFTEHDVDIIKLICCLKNTGMPIKEIKKYVDMLMSGDDTAEPRKNMMLDHRREVVRQIEELKKNLTIIDMKIAFYGSYNNGVHNEH